MINLCIFSTLAKLFWWGSSFSRLKMSQRGALTSVFQRSIVRGVGTSVAVLGDGAASRRLRGIGASIGKGGLPSRGSMVVGRPRTIAM